MCEEHQHSIREDGSVQSDDHTKTEQGFRVVITGKGGVGKTTLTALLSHLFTERGFTTLAVDEDPQMNLPYAVGVPPAESDRVVPLTKNLDYVEEKTGARPGAGWGLMLSLNPDVSDVVERFGVEGPGGVKILVMGTVVAAAAGCLCPENTLLESVMRYINLREHEVILMDTQAGVEHFGRAMAEGFDQAVLVTDPTFNAVQVVKHAATLAHELGIPTIHLVVNRVRSEGDIRKVQTILGDTLDLISAQFYLPYEEGLLACEPDVRPLLTSSPPSPFIEQVAGLQRALERDGTGRPSLP
jgi:CO dehydrogenase maturation factor